MDEDVINKVLYFLLSKDHHLPYAWIQQYGNDEKPVPGFGLILSELERLGLLDSNNDHSGHPQYMLTVPAREIINNLPFAYAGKPYQYLRYREGLQNAVTEEKLDLELGKLRREFEDYGTVRSRASEAHTWSKEGLKTSNRSLIVSGLAVLLVVIIEVLKRCKVWPFDN